MRTKYLRIFLMTVISAALVIPVLPAQGSSPVQKRQGIRDANGDGVCDITGLPMGTGVKNGKGSGNGKIAGPGDGTGNQGSGPRDGTGYGSTIGKRLGPQDGTGPGRTGSNGAGRRGGRR